MIFSFVSLLLELLRHLFGELLKMMAGLEELDSGGVLMPSATSVGYLPQDGLNHAGKTVFDEAIRAALNKPKPKKGGGCVLL